MSDLFQTRSQEFRADHLLPGDRIRRSGKIVLVERVAVTAFAATEIDARGSDGIAAGFRLPAGEIVAVVS